jgi:integrase
VPQNGLPELTLHGLRHVHASMLIAIGFPGKAVSERLGQSGIGITAEIKINSR